MRQCQRHHPLPGLAASAGQQLTLVEHPEKHAPLVGPPALLQHDLQPPRLRHHVLVQLPLKGRAPGRGEILRRAKVLFSTIDHFFANILTHDDYMLLAFFILCCQNFHHFD